MISILNYAAERGDEKTIKAVLNSVDANVWHEICDFNVYKTANGYIKPVSTHIETAKYTDINCFNFSFKDVFNV